MSRYPEHHGKYERTDLVKCRFRLTMITKRRDRLLKQAEQDRHELDALEQKIAELEKAEAK